MKLPGEPLVSVILVSFNTRDLTTSCIRSIQRCTRNVDYEIIVVDNASSDGTADAIRTEFPTITVLQSGRNAGFGYANNLGIAASRAPYVLLLNTDTELKNDALEHFLKKSVELEPFRVGCLGAFLVDREGKMQLSGGPFPRASREFLNLILSVGKEIATLLARLSGAGYPSTKTGGKTVPIKKYADCEVGFVTGANMFVPKSVLDAVGGFDPSYFLYYEDTEIQHRMMKKGYSRWLVRGPQIIHIGSGSLGGTGRPFHSRSMLYFNASRLKYLTRNSGWVSRTFLRSLFICVCGMRVLLSVMTPEENAQGARARILRDWVTGFLVYSGAELPWTERL